MKNNYKIRGEITVIYLNSKKYGRKEALIDTKNLEKLQKINKTWCLQYSPDSKTFYVVASGNLKLHRLLMNPEEKLQVDHIDHNGLNNLEKNLRVLTNAENAQNRRIDSYSNKSSKFRGVSWDKKANKWRAYITKNFKTINLGSFIDIEQAKNAVIEARKKYMPFSQEAIA